MILAYSWTRPAMLVAGKGRSGDVFSSPELCSGCAIVITFCPSSVRPSVNIFKRLL